MTIETIPYNIIVKAAALLVILWLLFSILLCNTYLGVCPGKWICNVFDQYFRNALPSSVVYDFARYIVINLIGLSCDKIPL